MKTKKVSEIQKSYFTCALEQTKRGAKAIITNINEIKYAHTYTRNVKGTSRVHFRRGKLIQHELPRVGGDEGAAPAQTHLVRRCSDL